MLVMLKNKVGLIRFSHPSASVAWAITTSDDGLLKQCILGRKTGSNRAPHFSTICADQKSSHIILEANHFWNREYHLYSWLTPTLNLCLAYFKITWALDILHMLKKLEINWTKIKGGCQSGRKVVTHSSKSDLPLDYNYFDTATEAVIWK